MRIKTEKRCLCSSGSSVANLSFLFMLIRVLSEVEVSWLNNFLRSYDMWRSILRSMDEFELPVSFNNKEFSFPARLLNYGYSYKLEVDIDGDKIMFEPDEERNWRALVAYEDINSNKKINIELLKAIVVSIEAIMK